MKKKVEIRDYVIDEIINITHIVYSNDRKMISSIIDLTVLLKTNESEEFINDIWGFLLWSQMTQQNVSWVLNTIIHDLAQFRDYRDKDWFCPRTMGYKKYLSGVSNIVIN